eukprot:1186177-Prorocentrum_minimum.AAC.4
MGIPTNGTNRRNAINELRATLVKSRGAFYRLRRVPPLLYEKIKVSERKSILVDTIRALLFEGRIAFSGGGAAHQRGLINNV